MSEISGITVRRATSFLSHDEHPNWASEDDTGYVRLVTDEPVYLMAEVIDDGIANGTLTAGQFAGVEVQPPVEQLPERWQHLFREL
jgi:hypothetical protein